MMLSLKFLQQPSKLETVKLFIYLLIALASISFGPILFRLNEQELNPNATVFYREVFAVIFLAPLSGTQLSQLWMQDRLLNTGFCNKKRIALMIFTGIIASFSTILWSWSVLKTTITNSSIIHSLVPIFVTLGSWLVLKHKLENKFILGMLIAITGSVILSLGDWQGGGSNFYGDTLALISTILYAIYLLCVEKLQVYFKTRTIILCRCLIGIILLFPILYYVNENCIPQTLYGWIFAIAIALVSQVLGQGLLAHSINGFSAHFVALSMLLIPVFSSIEAAFIFSEYVTISSWLSCFIILSGMYLAISTQDIMKTKSAE